MNSGHLEKPVSQSLRVANSALPNWTIQSVASCGTVMEKNNKNNLKNTNEQQLFLENKNGKIGSNGKPSTPRAKEGYCNEATQSGPSTHSKSHQTHNISKNTEVKQRMAWTREEITEIRKCCIYCRKHLTDNYKNV